MISKKYFLLLRVIGIFILGYILYLVDFNIVFEKINTTNLFFITYACVLVLVILFIKTLRWKFLLKSIHIKYKFRDAFLAFSASNFIAFVTPGRVGEVTKAYYIKKDTGQPVHKTISTVVIDRLFDVYLLTGVALIGIFRFMLFADLHVLNIIILLLIIVLPLILLSKKLSLPFLLWAVNAMIPDKIKSGTIEKLNSFYDSINMLSSIKLFITLCLTILAYGALFLSAFLICKSIHVNIEFTTIAIFISIANMLSFLPISIAGLGTREAALIYLFNLINHSKEEALVFSVFFFIVFFVFGGIIGYICFLFKSK